jgi:hypothetical protein
MPTDPSSVPPVGTATRDPFELFMGAHTQIREALGAMRILAAGVEASTPGTVQRGLAEQLMSPTGQGRLALAVLLSRLPVGKWGMV